MLDAGRVPATATTHSRLTPETDDTMKASSIVIVIGLLLTVFGIPIPGLSILGILILLLGAAARYLDF